VMWHQLSATSIVNYNFVGIILVIDFRFYPGAVGTVITSRRQRFSVTDRQVSSKMREQTL